MDNKQVGFIEDPTQAEAFLDSVKAENDSDRQMSKFLLQLRYARPSNVRGGRVRDSRFFDQFLDVVDELGYNQFLEVSDACTARICHPLRPRVEPVASKPDIQRACSMLNRLQDGVIETCNLLAESTSAWEDSYCTPLGFVLFGTDEKTSEIWARRTNPLQWYWRRDEGRNPIHLCFEDYVSRVVLVNQYPDSEEAIITADNESPETIEGVDPPTTGNADTVRVCHVWRREIGDEAGKYVIAVGRHVLNGDTDDNGNHQGVEWPYDFFPVAVFRNRWDHSGFGGVPMGRHIAPHHIAINRLARTADEGFKGAIPFVLEHRDARLSARSNVPFHRETWEGGVPPQVIVPNAVSDQLLRRIDYHDAKAYALAGINKALAAGQAPKGVVAAVAMREIVELADARANEYQKQWEAGWEMAGHVIVALANELKKVKVRSASKGSSAQQLISEIDVTKIKLDRNDYRIRYGITSALSETVSGLLSDLNEFKDLGFVTPVKMAIALGDKVPDLQAWLDEDTAPYRLAQKMVQEALDEGTISVPPSKMMGKEGLDSIIVIGQKAWCQAMINPDQVSPENLQALHLLMKIAASKSAGPQQPAMPRVQPGQPMAPGAVVPVGTPVAAGSVGTVARNKYEAASLGVQIPGETPPVPQPQPQP